MYSVSLALALPPGLFDSNTTASMDPSVRAAASCEVTSAAFGPSIPPSSATTATVASGSLAIENANGATASPTTIPRTTNSFQDSASCRESRWSRESSTDTDGRTERG